MFKTTVFKKVENDEFFLASVEKGPVMLYRRIGDNGLVECLDTYIGTRHGAHQFSREESETIYLGSNHEVLKFKYKVNIGA